MHNRAYCTVYFTLTYGSKEISGRYELTDHKLGKKRERIRE